MEILSTVVNAAVIAAVGFLLPWQFRGHFAVLERRMDGLDERMDGLDKRMDGVDKRMDGFDRRMDSFQGSLESMRSDLTQVALAVGARPRGNEA